MGEFEKDKSLLAQTFSHHREHFEYVDGLGDYQDVTHPEANKKWELLRIIP